VPELLIQNGAEVSAVTNLAQTAFELFVELSPSKRAHVADTPMITHPHRKKFDRVTAYETAVRANFLFEFLFIFFFLWAFDNWCGSCRWRISSRLSLTPLSSLWCLRWATICCLLALLLASFVGCLLLRLGLAACLHRLSRVRLGTDSRNWKIV